MPQNLSNYQIKEGFLDEVYKDSYTPHDHYSDIIDLLKSLGIEEFRRLNQATKLAFLNMGITYAVYGEGNNGKEKIFPFDMIPRIVDYDEWIKIEQGITQRNLALNMFISDVYNAQKVFKDRIVPSELVLSSQHYLKEMVGFKTPAKIHCHIAGTDLIRHSDGNMYVLEDNLRVPSGVSYVIMNRKIMQRSFAPVFKAKEILPVSLYTDQLLKMMYSLSPRKRENPVCVILTPGQYNSAYYEHSFLAQEMGIDLVEGRDLFVEDDVVFMKTTAGPIRVDVIYRRVDDLFLDPAVFNKDSVLGIRGLMSSYFKGNVAIVNAPGNGFADDKAICTYVPDLIKYYLSEEPIIANVPTYVCDRPEDLSYVMTHLHELVIKPVDMSGGYGVMICETLDKKSLENVRLEVLAEPRRFIAQPRMCLSTHMTYIDDDNAFEARHIDLRTFNLAGKGLNYVLPGGLTRVALKKNSLIVNSSQGGGSKDTWVLKKI